jgi:hypothetical protein
MNEATELTLRDVLQQIDRRLTVLEADVRNLGSELRTEMKTLASALRAEMNTLASELRAEMRALDGRWESRFQALEVRIERLEARMSTQFRWTIGIIMGGWLSLAGLIVGVYVQILQRL